MSPRRALGPRVLRPPSATRSKFRPGLSLGRRPGARVVLGLLAAIALRVAEVVLQLALELQGYLLIGGPSSARSPHTQHFGESRPAGHASERSLVRFDAVPSAAGA